MRYNGRLVHKVWVGRTRKGVEIRLLGRAGKSALYALKSVELNGKALEPALRELLPELPEAPGNGAGLGI